MLSIFRIAAQSVAAASSSAAARSGGGSGSVVRSGCSGFLAPQLPRLAPAPLAPARPYRYTPPVQVRWMVDACMYVCCGCYPDHIDGLTRLSSGSV